MAKKDPEVQEDHQLSPEQNLLFTRLEREATPILQKRADAARALGLVRTVLAVEEELKVARQLRPDSLTQRNSENLKRDWDSLMRRLDGWILEELKRGRLIAYGLSLPVTPSTIAMPIPTGLWHTHELDIEKGQVLGEHWSFKELRVVSTTTMSPRQRELVLNGLWVFGTWFAEENLETLRQEAERQEANRRSDPRSSIATTSPLGATPANPLHVSITSVAERVVVKTEALRRNTLHGKPDAGKSAKPEQRQDIKPGMQRLVPEDARRLPRKSGPRSLNPEIELYLKERSEKEECKPTWLEESLHLHAWAKHKFAQEIRIQARRLAKIKRLREVHATTYYQLNPKFDRLRRFKQESA